MILYGLAGAGIVGLVVALLAVFVLGRGGTSKAHFDGPAVDFANMPGLMRKAPPWPKNTADLDARAKQIGVQILPTEGVKLHIHQHLDIYVDGKHATVPPLIGIARTGNRATSSPSCTRTPPTGSSTSSPNAPRPSRSGSSSASGGSISPRTASAISARRRTTSRST